MQLVRRPSKSAEDGRDGRRGTPWHLCLFLVLVVVGQRRALSEQPSARRWKPREVSNSKIRVVDSQPWSASIQSVSSETLSLRYTFPLEISESSRNMLKAPDSAKTTRCAEEIAIGKNVAKKMQKTSENTELWTVTGRTWRSPSTRVCCASCRGSTCLLPLERQPNLALSLVLVTSTSEWPQLTPNMSNAVEDHSWSETLRPSYHISSFLIPHLPSPNRTNTVSRQSRKHSSHRDPCRVCVSVHTSQELNPSTTTPPVGVVLITPSSWFGWTTTRWCLIV